ncbi:MAG: hypothetical protein R6U91_05620 [Bacillota bacterium]
MKVTFAHMGTLTLIIELLAEELGHGDYGSGKSRSAIRVGW